MQKTRANQKRTHKILVSLVIFAFLAESSVPFFVVAQEKYVGTGSQANSINYKADSAGTNDPYYDSLWALAKIKAPAAWENMDNKAKVIIAVVDTGVDYQHEDLAENIWTNTKEISSNGIDDDKNGFVDDVHGWDFFNGDNNPMDDGGHGTQVAGVIGAMANNNKGITGVAPNVKIMPLKCLGADDQGTSQKCADAIKYAVDNGASVINASWSAKSAGNQKLAEAINYAYKKNVAVFVSAGNDNSNADGYVPANIKYALAVSATNTEDKKSSFSNWGDAVAFSAPGEKIKTTVVGNKYKSYKGTSFAVAYASGVAALLYLVKSSLTVDEVRILLQNSADDLGKTGWDKNFGAGRINADKAVRYLLSGNYIADLASLGTIANKRANIVYFNPEGTSVKAADSSNSSSDSHSKKKSKKKKKKSLPNTIKNSVNSVSRGQVLVQSGKKFSKNSLVRAYFSKPGGGYYSPKTIMTDSNGNFLTDYQVWKPAGTYFWFAVDAKTGKRSKTISYQVK
ncbi:MAG: S8 family peptidase [Parcubacteria group bacterium]